MAGPYLYPGRRGREHPALGVPDRPDSAAGHAQNQRQRDGWWGNRKAIYFGETTTRRLGSQRPSPECSKHVQVHIKKVWDTDRGSEQVGSEGQVTTVLGSGTRLRAVPALQGEVSVPTGDALPAGVCLGGEISQEGRIRKHRRRSTGRGLAASLLQESILPSTGKEPIRHASGPVPGSPAGSSREPAARPPRPRARSERAAGASSGSPAHPGARRRQPARSPPRSSLQPGDASRPQSGAAGPPQAQLWPHFRLTRARNPQTSGGAPKRTRQLGTRLPASAPEVPTAQSRTQEAGTRPELPAADWSARGWPRIGPSSFWPRIGRPRVARGAVCRGGSGEGSRSRRKLRGSGFRGARGSLGALSARPRAAPGRRRAPSRGHERGLHRRGPAGLCAGAGLHGRR